MGETGSDGTVGKSVGGATGWWAVYVFVFGRVWVKSCRWNTDGRRGRSASRSGLP